MKATTGHELIRSESAPDVCTYRTYVTIRFPGGITQTSFDGRLTRKEALEKAHDHYSRIGGFSTYFLNNLSHIIRGNRFAGW